MADLVSQMFSGDRLALSRLISMVEARSGDLVSLMSQVQTRCGKAYKIGVTGPPGAGKSTLTDKLIAHLRKQGKTVGVVAIDPSSPFSGGAVLGDRIRMQDHAGDEGVFIRSLGSRGSLGGISRATREVVKLFDAFGMDHVIVETVGVGQTELDIMEIVDTTVVILTPESGDAIQTMKAGILEIADVFVVNKSDRDGAPMMQAELKAMLELGAHGPSDWMPPALLVQANKDQGVRELLNAIEDHHAFRRQAHPDAGKKRKIALEEVKEIVLEETALRLAKILPDEVKGEISNPYDVASGYVNLIEKALRKKQNG
ncbi:MAG TPA: methylmalonyl Co-A mutase-associated GTPase MeaB [bacterium]|nr:methylmalonyl Co-A mutase-associated GTPase MeaB [bacterium]